tara:strand:- start:639 stop:845 length:207 start_codon:yes stop_codon:yes gene_type:complete
MTKKDTRRDAWNFDYVGMKAYISPKEKKYQDWVYMADDQMNKVLKTVVILLHVYGLFVFVKAVWEKFL